MADVKSLEHPTLKVPYEILNKRFRSAQKVVDREVSHVTGSLAELEKLLAGGAVDRVTLTQQLDNIKEQLVGLRSKGAESLAEEARVATLCRARAVHLREGCGEEVAGGGGGQSKQWRRARLDRMLVEHFLRQGFYDSAIELARSEGLEDLTNIEVFLTAREVEQSLQRADISKCLAWCHDNKSKLRKMKSSLEFNVRLQEFIELVKAGERLEAVRHAKKHLASEELGQLEVVQQGMGLLAFPLDTLIQPYKDLLDTGRWQQLIEQFRAENYRLHQLSSQSMFTVALQVGRG
jgi:macrophage erythroblast attacher